MSAKKTIMWHGFSDVADAMLDSSDMSAKKIGEKTKMPRNQNQNSGILRGPKLKLQIFFFLFFFPHTRTTNLPSSTIFSTSSHFFHHFLHLLPFYILVSCIN
jgi:hypothetical protein